VTGGFRKLVGILIFPGKEITYQYHRCEVKNNNAEIDQRKMFHIRFSMRKNVAAYTNLYVAGGV
jgi:hypothetical protein